MYRARVEAVSGTKVYAGGKWLQCIGNKNVRVGDLVWTDGGCVYGNQNISQQPMIITAPFGEEGIPIIALTYPFAKPVYYTYSKNKMSPLDKQIDIPINNALIANDTKGNVFVYNGNSKVIKTNGNVKTCRELIAVNIIGLRNRFEVFWDYEVEDSGISNYGSIKIMKNGELLHIVDLESVVQNIVEKLPFVPTPEDNNGYYSATLYMTGAFIEHGFIENENRWGLFFEMEPTIILRQEIEFPTAQLYIFHEVNDAPSLIILRILDAYHVYGSKAQLKQYISERQYDIVTYEAPQRASVTNIVYIDLDGVHTIDEHKLHVIKDKIIIKPIQTFPELTSLKFFLHGRYFYKMSLPPEPFTGDFAAEKIFFTPAGSTIFKLITYITTRHLLTKTKNGYLFFSNEPFWTEPYNPHNGNPAGVYFFGKDGFTLLIETHRFYRNGVLNQQLRPMKNINHWEKRIQELTLNL